MAAVAAGATANAERADPDHDALLDIGQASDGGVSCAVRWLMRSAEMPGSLEFKVWRMLVTLLDKNDTEDCKSKMSCDTRPRGSGPAGLSATGACGSTEASCIACAPESATTTLCSTFISLSLEELTPSGSARDTDW